MVIDFMKFARRHREIAPTERRAAPRGRVLLSGKIVYGNGLTADCAIRNLSPTGARVDLPAQQRSPGAFDLIIVRDGAVHRSRTCWTENSVAGVVFEDSHYFADPTPPPLQPLRELWVELAPRP